MNSSIIIYNLHASRLVALIQQGPEKLKNWIKFKIKNFYNNRCTQISPFNSTKWVNRLTLDWEGEVKDRYENNLFSIGDTLPLAFGSKAWDGGPEEIINPWFVTGLIDAEGCFHLGITVNDNYKNNYKVSLMFTMSLHQKDKDLLIKLKDFFNVGSVIKHGPSSLQYKVSSVKDLSILILHCNNYPLISYKRIDFELFKKAYDLIKIKLHLTDDGFNNILSIKSSINLGLTDKLKLAFPNILATPRLLKPAQGENPNMDLSLAGEYGPGKIQNSNWISGFTSGDGCFHVSLSKSTFTKTGYRVVLRFQIAQHYRDNKLMISLLTYLNCGRIEENLEKSMSYFVVSKFNDITDIIIPFFDKYPIHGVKLLDYINFKEIATLMKEKEHLNIEGIDKIKMIKSKMNKFRE